MRDNLKLINLLRKCFSNDKLCMFYRGNFDDTFTDKLIALADHDVEKKAKNRISILMSESFQNILRHGNKELSNNHDSLFGIRVVAPFLEIFSSNIVDEKDKLFLEKNISHINTLNKEELKEYYMKVLADGTLSGKGGAGLGLIEMAKKSQKPIQMKFRKLENKSFAFNMQIDMVVDDAASKELLDNPMEIEENTAMNDLMADNNIVFLYKGEFNDETISPMLNILEGNTSDSNNSIGFKVYHAAVELMQNVARHSAESGMKEGLFAINESPGGCYLCTGNYIGGSIHETEEWIKKLNSMSKDELNKLYRTRLKDSINLPGNSAGVGLIDLRRNFMTQIDFKLVEEKVGNYLIIGIEIPYGK